MTASTRVVRRGRIRVDARKAMAKLRDHLLVDLHQYAIEVVRASAVAGARRVDVTYDADDVAVTFDGRALPAAELPRLFEHLIGEPGDDPAQQERLLALAVNAALGLDPAWVALTSASDGVAARVTWSPSLVAAIEREEAPLPEPEVIAVPPGMPGTGTRLHLRRKVGWEMVRRVAGRAPPREVTLLAAAAVSLRAPLFVNGEPLAPAPRPAALARAPFKLAGARSAAVEVTATTDVAPHAELCELGALLARTSFAFGRHFPMAGHLGVAPPVRVVVDSDALPTNASRSAVREDAPLFMALGAAAAPALSDAIMGIAAALFGRGPAPEGVTVDGRDPDALRDALGAFLCCAEASILGRVPLPEALRSLLDLPLFSDGLGRPLARSELPQKDPLPVWTDDAPVPEELAPWARGIVWRRRRVAERVLSGRACMEPDQLRQIAQRGALRRRRHLAAPAGEASVLEGSYLARERLRFEDGPLGGLSGEVAISDGRAAYVRNHALRVFVEGRCFDVLPLPEDGVPLECVIAIEWPGHVTPTFAYEGVEVTHGLRAAVAVAVRQAVLLCERLAAGRAALDPDAAAAARAALATSTLAPSRMYSAQGFEMPALADLPALVGAPVWPTTDGRLVSLRELAERAARTGAVCVASIGATGRAVDGRPVVCAPTREIEWLKGCLHPDVALVYYDVALPMGSAPAAVRAARAALVAAADADASATGAPALFTQAEGLAAAVTIGGSALLVWHAGVQVARTPLADDLGGVTIAIDDDSIVPAPSWQGVLHTRDQGAALRAERAFAERLTSALLGDAAARGGLLRALAGGGSRYAFPEDPAALPHVVRRYLIDRAARGRAEGASGEDRALGARVEMIPLLRIFGDSGELLPASLAHLARAHPEPGPIPHLAAPPPFRPSGWRPLIEPSEAALAALGRWSRGRLKDARAELPEQQRAAERAARREQLRKRPALDPNVPGQNADPHGPVVVLPAAPKYGLHGIAAALLRPDLPVEHALVEVLHEDRLVSAEPLTGTMVPVAARVSIIDERSLDGLERLSPYGVGGAGARVFQAATELAVKLLERAQRPGEARTFFGDARALRLVLAVLSQPIDAQRVASLLTGGALLFPTVQGEEHPYKALFTADGALWIGGEVHASWIRPEGPPSHLDRPILHVPASPLGELLGRVLARLGVKVRIVTDAIASLQQKRSRGAARRPELAARPPHPRLARDLAALGISDAEGEIAIYESGDSLAEISALDGEVRRVPFDTPFPVRAVARTEILTGSAAQLLAERLGRAAVRLLLELIPSLDELPALVRGHLRALVCRALSKDRELPKVAAAAPIFPDIDGAWWSLDALRAGEAGDLCCTFDPPPYPAARQEGRTLALTPAEHLQLHRRIKILNVTEWMRRDLDAERRREGPQVEGLRLDAETRAQVLSSFTVAEGALEGEIGVLSPGADARRGLQVHVTRRLVCKLDDGPGWPLAAILDDDALRPSRWFDALLPADEIALRSRVRSLATRHLEARLRASLPPPSTRLASAFLDEPIPIAAAYGSTEPMSVLGHVVLPSEWPVIPSVQLYVQGLAQPAGQALALAAAPIDPILPITGALFVAHGAPTFTRGAACRLALALRDAARRLLEPLLRESPEDPLLQMYAWNLRLLGSQGASSPTAVTADGRLLGADEVIAALQGGGEIWLSDRRGSLDGAFPDEAPPFVLPDDASPLTRVLRARVPRERLRRLGELEQKDAAPTSVPPSLRDGALAPPSIPPPAAEGGAELTSGRSSRSWLAGLVARVASLFAGAPDAGARAAESDPAGLTAAVERTLRALRLRDDPVISVREVRRGRLVRYDERDRVVSLNVAHPALARHLAAPTPAALRRACVALVAAALSEVNIALEHVTDHDEEQALLELLRQEAAAAAAPGE